MRRNLDCRHACVQMKDPVKENMAMHKPRRQASEETKTKLWEQIPIVFATQSVVLCYGNLSKLIRHLSVIAIAWLVWLDLLEDPAWLDCFMNSVRSSLERLSTHCHRYFRGHVAPTLFFFSFSRPKQRSILLCLVFLINNNKEEQLSTVTCNMGEVQNGENVTCLILLLSPYGMEERLLPMTGLES